MKWFRERWLGSPRKQGEEEEDLALSKMPGLGGGSRRNPRLMNKLIDHWDALVIQKLFETPSIDTWQHGKTHYPKKMNFGCWKRASEVDPRLSLLLPSLFLSSLCLSDGMERNHFR